MASSRNPNTKNVPPKDSESSWSGIEQRRKTHSVSEAASQNDEKNSVISETDAQESDIEEIPRMETQPTSTAVQYAPSPRGIQFDRLKPISSLTRPLSPAQGLFGEVQRRGIDPIQPVQTVAKPANAALSLRLDLNLDVEIDLKASIHGDLTLSLLT